MNNKKMSFNLYLFLRDLTLFLMNPKDFLFSFTYSTKKKVNIKKYDPNSKKLSNLIIKSITNSIPDLKIEFIGSSSFGIMGESDIDLVAGVELQKFNYYLPKIIKVLGNPTKIKNRFIEWNFKKDSYQIEFSLVDSSSDIYKRKVHAYKILTNNDDLLKKYEALKKISLDISEREYDRRKLWFFTKIRYF